MIKELLICSIIIVIIVIGNSVTHKYTMDSIEKLNEKLVNLEQLIKDNKEKKTEEVDKKQNEIYDDWKNMFSKLAYYIEHQELEKFAINLENIKTYLELEQFDDAIKEINEGIYILNHIEEKYSFSWQNIF